MNDENEELEEQSSLDNQQMRKLGQKVKDGAAQVGKQTAKKAGQAAKAGIKHLWNLIPPQYRLIVIAVLAGIIILTIAIFAAIIWWGNVKTCYAESVKTKEQIMTDIEIKKKNGKYYLDFNEDNIKEFRKYLEESDVSVEDFYLDEKYNYLEKMLYAEAAIMYPNLIPNDEQEDDEFDGIINIIRSDLDQKQKVLKYIPLNSFPEDETALDYYSIDTSGNLVVAYYEKTIKDGEVTNYEIKIKKIPYQSLVANYNMPFEFTLALLQISDNPEWISAVTDLAMTQSKVDFIVQDCLTKVTSELEPNKEYYYGSVKGYIKTADIWFAKMEEKYEKKIYSEDGTTTTTFEKVGATEKNEASEKFLGLWRNKTGIYEKYFDDDGNVNENAKFDKQGKEVKYQIPNTDTWESPTGNLLSATEATFDLLETTEKTQNSEMIYKYMLYKYTGVNYGVDQIDFEVFNTSSFNSVGSISSGSFIVKTNELNAAPAVAREDLAIGIKQWLSGNQQANALSVLDAVLECQDNYNVNAVFVYGVMATECSMGTANTSWVRENNWTSLTGLGHIQYESPSANIKKMTSMIANGSIYFSTGRYSVHQIGELYCAEPPPPEWANEVTQHMIDLYNAIGIDANPQQGENSEIVSLAQSKLGCEYVLGAHGPNTFDCSGFVEWCYRQLGINVPWSTDAYKSYKGSQYEISWEEAKPGDILIVFNTERGTTYGHAGIYLGNDEYIHAPQTGDVVKISKGAKNKFKHVFRF